MGINYNVETIIYQLVTGHGPNQSGADFTPYYKVKEQVGAM